MKAIMVMFDSLRRDLLAPYGCDWTITPNFQRLAAKSACFDNNYVGSMPCMPARRELHTGRYNFLHRSWGPLEPFDDSMPEILKRNGIHSHLVSDHKHYWADGGSTYHTRYSTWEAVRGQQGDPWKCNISLRQPVEMEYVMPASLGANSEARIQDIINRTCTDTEETMPQAITFRSGLEFIETNRNADDWFLQIETFDPHEPFYCMPEYKELYPHKYDGKPADWPPYYFVQEDPDIVSHVRYEYASLLSMCDCYLGKVLDKMDEYNLWADTMLIVNTDHGFLLGEHEWWSKSVMPVYNEIAHTPLFIYDPRCNIQGERRISLTQTIDLPATLLEFFKLPIPADMQGKPLRQTIAEDTPVRDYALFGYHNGQANITDGEYLYMRSPACADGGPLYEYTLMPTHMRGFFSADELAEARLAKPFSFTKGMPVLKTPAKPDWNAPVHFGSKLFYLPDDPGQECELKEAEAECKMANLLVRAMKENDAPAEQYKRLDLNFSEKITVSDIQDSYKKGGKVTPQKILMDRVWSRPAAAMLCVLYDITCPNELVMEQFPGYIGDKSPIEAKDVMNFIRDTFDEDKDFLLYVVGLASRTT